MPQGELPYNRGLVPGIGVITNPRSRVNKRDPAQMRSLGYLLGSEGAAEATRSLDDLYRAAEEFKAAGIDILGINGGDGTIHVTLSAFLEVYGDAPFPKIAILRGGTLNTIARGLGIKGKTQEILYQVIDRYHQGEAFKLVERPIMKLNDSFGFIMGNGIVANFLEAYYATGRPSPMTGATTLLHAVGSAIFRTPFTKRLMQRFHGRVVVDGEPWAREDFVTVTAATVPELGLGFAPYYRCWESLEHFAILGIHCSAVGLAMELPRIYRARPIRRDRAISVLAKHVVIESDDEFAYAVDGDVHKTKGKLEMSVGRVLQIIVPDDPNAYTRESTKELARPALNPE